MQAEGMHFSSFLLIQGLPHAGRGVAFFILSPDPGATTCRQRGCIVHPSSGSVTNFIISKFIITKFIRNIFHTPKTLYVTKFIRYKIYTSHFLYVTIFIWNIFYTSQNLYVT
jgi:hypothetical protein